MNGGVDWFDPHLREIRRVVVPGSDGCEECLRLGTTWLQLRLCLSCGHVGCCDSSPGLHARKHAHAVRHPISQSYEVNEDWRWCYVHEMVV